MLAPISRFRKKKNYIFEFIFKHSLQVALVHVFFNVFGVAIWCVVPFMRKIPIGVAKFCGRRAEKYRWWGAFYLVTMFIAFPVLVFGISLGSAITASGIDFKNSERNSMLGNISLI